VNSSRAITPRCSLSLSLSLSLGQKVDCSAPGRGVALLERHLAAVDRLAAAVVLDHERPIKLDALGDAHGAGPQSAEPRRVGDDRKVCSHYAALLATRRVVASISSSARTTSISRPKNSN